LWQTHVGRKHEIICALEDAGFVAGKNCSSWLLVSTSELSGEPEVHSQPETYWGHVNPVGPRSVYDEAGRYAEAFPACFRRESLVDAGIVRLFNAYGPGMRPDDGQLVPTLIRQALQGTPQTSTGTGEQTRSWCNIDEAVRGLLAFLNFSHPGPVNIGGDRETTVREVADLIAALTGCSVPPVFVARPADDPSGRCPDITLAADLLGWAPNVALVEGLAKTAELAIPARPVPGALR
jgi:dTDP-glucose 4,6-dehydratase